MLDRLKSIEERYEKLNELLSDPEVVNDPKKLREYSKEQSDIQETINGIWDKNSLLEVVKIPAIK